MRPPAGPSFPSTDRIFPRLTEFVGYVRRQGVPVGIEGEVDLARALAEVAVLDREEFRSACRVTLAKSPEELKRLDDAFELFWSLNAPLLDIPFPGEAPLSHRPRSTPTGELGERRPAPRETVPPTSLVELGTYSASAPAPGHGIEPLSDREMRAVRRGTRRFRRMVATLPGRRLVGARRGTIDFAATFRHNLRHGGEWLEFRYARPQLGRSELLILWDVSGSMREHDSRLFALVHALVRVSRSARVVAFSTRVEEVTADVRRFGYRRAVERVGARIDRSEGGTRIGACLSEFVKRFGSLVRPTATILILSDGWDLGESELVGAELRWIARRAELVVWVNPYARQRGFSPETGALRAALPHTDLLLGPEDFETPFAPRGTPPLPARARAAA